MKLLSHRAASGTLRRSNVSARRIVTTGQSVGARMEALEQLLMRAADPVISEFLAKNTGALLDADGDASDWIEIYNRGDATLQLQGWHLTDDAAAPAKWTFPSKTLAAGARLVVFASSKDKTDSAGNLHTNFSLSTDGERLELVKPDLTVVSAYGTSGNYPAQFADVSYGVGTIYDNTTLIGPTANAKAFIPTNGSIDNGTWVNANFNDSSWLSSTSNVSGVGFDTGAYEDNSTAPVLKANWNADDLAASLTTGSRVASWSSEVGTNVTATASGNPILRTGQFNGHAAVQFLPSDGADNLRVAAGVNPMSGAGDFTLAVVFRASSGTGASGASNNYSDNAGLVDAEAGSGISDWGVGIAANGHVGAGTATPSRTVYDSKNAANAQPHVLVFTCTGTSISLYIDGGDGTTRADASTAARVVGDMVFGSSQLNAKYLTGDIAQVMVYSGWMNLGRAYNTALTLGSKYGVTIAAPSVALAPVLQADWSADALNANADGATISGNWTSVQNARTANAVTEGAPKLKKNSLNGHSVVRFDSTDGTNDAFRLPAAQNPISNSTSFGVSIVFRTSTPGRGVATDWYDNTGLVDSEQGGVQNDWGLAFNGSGQVAGGFGNPDDTIYSAGGLADGTAHVAVFTHQGTTDTLSIDGGAPRTLPASATARNSTDLVIGAIQTEVGGSFFTGDIADVRVYGGTIDADSGRTIALQLGSMYGLTIAPSVYAPLIGLDVGAQMAGLASTAAIRYGFTVDGDPTRFTRLQLSMQYDDGFVAYLNGVEVARRNAPGGAITYTSTATSQRNDGDALTPETIDISSFRNLLQGNGATNVLAIRALNLSATDSDLLIVPQLIASTSTTGVAYFSTPTPGAANADGYLGVAALPTFSKQHGYYTGTQSISVTAGTPGATLVYTLDGSAPSLTNGIKVLAANPSATASATLSISASTTIRAVTLRNLYLPSQIAAQSYLFTSSVITQTNTAPPGAYWSSAVDPRVAALTNQGYTVDQALKSIPSVSLVMDPNDMFGPSGLYQNPAQKGDDWERQTSIEYFDPNKTSDAGFSMNAGIRIQGGAGRSTSNPKRSFRIYFRSQYGASQLDYPLFRSGAATTIQDKFVLRAFNNESWASDNDGSADFIHDMFARRLQAQQQGRASAVDGAFVQLYINGQYWGLYTLDEDPDSDWAANHFGGASSDYEVIEPDGTGGIEVKTDLADGEMSLYSQLFTTVTGMMSDNVISDAELATIKTKLDVPNLIDFMINEIYRGDRDSPTVITNRRDPRNFYAFVNKADGHYKFANWDGELAMDDLNADKTEVNNEAPFNGGHDGPGYLWQSLRTNAEFKQLVADRLYKAFYNNGVLQVDAANGINNPRALYDTMKTEVDAAVVGESLRWGSAHRSYPLLRVSDWTNAIASKYSYLAQRSDIVKAQFKTDFPAFGLLPPVYKIGTTVTRGGTITSGAAVSLVEQNANAAGDQIYYTLDGSDPRGAGGAVLGTPYSGPITISGNKTLTVRILNGTTWSPIDAVSFSVDVPANASNLAITEFHYHPTNVTAAELAVSSAFTEDDFEYVELTNTSAGSIAVGGLTFSAGITGTLAAASLAAGERAVVVKNLAAFRARFGTSIRVLATTTTSSSGAYGGSLSNSGETLTLKAADGTLIRSVAYTDGGTNDGWSTRADGDGSSLEIVNANGNYNDPTNWRPSYSFDGTPAAVAILAPSQSVVINEFVTASASGAKSIELYNRQPGSFDLTGWGLGDGGGLDWTFPAGTTIDANSYLVIDSSDWASAAATFNLRGASGGNLYLFRSNGVKPVGFADAVTYGSSVVGESFSRIPNGTGSFYPSATPTLGAANAGPRVGPATITELVYNPTGANLNLQYVEVQNQTASTLDLSGWSFNSGISFTVPSGTTLLPHEPALFVHFNPNTDTAAVTAFRTAYGLDSSTKLIGPFTGDLSTAGEEVRLVRPDAVQPSEPTVTPMVIVDDFTYGITSPWPTVASGQALTRLSSKVYGQATSNWTAAAPSAGIIDYGNAWFAGPTARTFTGRASSFDSLTINGTAASVGLGTDAVLRTGEISLLNGAKFDVASGTLLIDYTGSTPSAAIRDALVTGYSSGTWTGAGITSSTAAATAGHTLGWAEATSIPAAIRSTFSDSPIDDTTLIVRFTRGGDANLNRTVDFDDLLALAQNYNATGGKTSAQGEFNYDASGAVTFDDLLVLAKNYGQSATLPAAASATAAKATTRTRTSVASDVMGA